MNFLELDNAERDVLAGGHRTTCSSADGRRRRFFAIGDEARGVSCFLLPLGVLVLIQYGGGAFSRLKKREGVGGSEEVRCVMNAAGCGSHLSGVGEEGLEFAVFQLLTQHLRGATSAGSPNNFATRRRATPSWMHVLCTLHAIPTHANITCTAVERANGGMRSSSFLGLRFSILRLVRQVYTVSSSVCTAPSL